MLLGLQLVIQPSMSGQRRTTICRDLVSLEACSEVIISTSQLQPVAANEPLSSVPLAKSMLGHDVTPATVRDVLQAGSAGQCPTSMKSASARDDNGVASTDCIAGDDVENRSTTSDVEANALLWALKNLWFGVEEDMTSYAYTVCIASCSAEHKADLTVLHRVEQGSSLVKSQWLDDSNRVLETIGSFQLGSEWS